MAEIFDPKNQPFYPEGEGVSKDCSFCCELAFQRRTDPITSNPRIAIVYTVSLVRETFKWVGTSRMKNSGTLTIEHFDLNYCPKCGRKIDTL